MPTKRPDQLPEGEDFDFDDILMVEKDADSETRKLYKTKLREFMRSALKMDPERLGENAILGTQSKFDWLVEQMEKISQSPIVDINDYDDFDSESKQKEQQYITPTPTPSASVQPTPTPTPTVTTSPRDPNAPIPSATPTPTPSVSSKPLTKVVTFSVQDFHSAIFDIDPNYLPEVHGYNNWNFVNGQDTDNIYTLFSGYFPKKFTPSLMGERLLTLRKLNNSQIKLEVVLLDDFGRVQSIQGLKNNSSLEIDIIYS